MPRTWRGNPTTGRGGSTSTGTRRAANATQRRCTREICPQTGTARTGAALATSLACRRRPHLQESVADTPQPCHWQSWGRAGEPTHGCPALPRWGSAAVLVIASCQRSSMTDSSSERKRVVFSTSVAAAAAVPDPQLPPPSSAGHRATRHAPSMTSAPTRSSTASDISSSLPGPGGHCAPPLAPQRQQVVMPITPTHATAATDYLTKRCPST